MSRLLIRTLGAAALFVLAAPAFAQSVNGCWATVDDEDGTVKSYVKIYDEGSTKVGDIVRLTVNGGRCVDCADRFDGRVLRNERIMSGFRADGDRYEGGSIVDPKSGRSYNAVMNLMEGNSDRLYLRGYLGIRALGRSQTWRRVPTSNCQ
ncbi:DUF2147 domain-containing protein [Rubrivirga marina]|uniref:DUF2147 domain-containing protein n=1 Tax=Rubrivirga marina TaxID=1196024 RepID=A0A271J5J9_9BACT|nr:DUF2147 domain-containing protein [Rubrivirga marina]PAP78792.1 hypothetical protein BSZ37_14780 [Rubrivirga marina]